jgi:hypothetical protein
MFTLSVTFSPIFTGQRFKKKNPLLSYSEISLGFKPSAVAKQFIHQGISFVNPAKEAIKIGYHIFL